jgi:uncharacterized protein
MMKLQKAQWLVIGSVVVALALLAIFIPYYGDWLWFENLGFAKVFTTILWAKALAFAAFALLFGIFAGVNLFIARKQGYSPRKMRVVPPQGANTPIDLIFHSAHAAKVWTLVLLFLSVVMGLSASGSWLTFLQYLYHSPFGVADPIFSKDVGFYVFTLPLYSFLQKWLLSALFLVFIAVGFSYYLDQGIVIQETSIYAYPRVKAHLGVLGGLFFLDLAWAYRLKSYGLLNSSSGVVYGAGYSDVHALLPAYWALLILAVVIAVLLFFMPVIKKWRWALYAIGVFFVALIGLSWIYPTIIQQYIVKPNELAKETPYIEHNIKFTRLGFGLNKALEQPFALKNTLTYSDIEKNSATIHNIRLWDRRPLIQTYKQLQEIRLYYDFNSVDVDRYHFQDKYTEVALAARELAPSQLPAPARTWVNAHLVYTHGYGVVMSPVNEETGDGMPKFIIKDIPPRSSGAVQVTRPAIYYGEETKDFTIVHTKTREFDYPKGDKNVYTSYRGKGGVQLSSLFRRVVYADVLSDFNILLSGYITPESRIMFHRIITDRDRTIAPFLAYDSDPYLVVGNDGHLYWIHDAYTTSSMFPYSEPVSQGLGRKTYNYIRNSVKVVIDAYNGDVTYYVVDPSDPIIQTYQKIFPTLFKPISAMPSFLRQHLRYPSDLFIVQAHMYATYHMTDPQVFYNREDLWNIPQAVFNGVPQSILPYYIIMKLPDAKSAEFILMLPLTPAKKDNMVAWMCARCDGSHYGQLLIYTLSKDKLIYGPMQIEARINQQPSISAELTLWGQQGSSVIRGNLLVIPIEHSFIYVEPVYLQATQSQMPQLKRVIAVEDGKLKMEKSLDAALKAVFAVTGVPPQQQQKVLSGSPVGPLPAGAQEALDHYNQAMEYLKQANWTKYGEELNQLKKILETMAGKGKGKP